MPSNARNYVVIEFVNVHNCFVEEHIRKIPVNSIVSLYVHKTLESLSTL